MFLNMIAPSLKIKIQNCLFIKNLSTNKVVKLMVNAKEEKEEKKNHLKALLNKATTFIKEDIFRMKSKKSATSWKGLTVQIGSMINKAQNQLANEFLDTIISKLGTTLSVPEEHIFEQDDEG